MRITIRSWRLRRTRSGATGPASRCSETGPRGLASGPERPSMSLFRRAVAVNVTVLVIAALVLALSPATVSATVTPSEWIVLTAGTAAVIVVNLLLLRRVFGPLERLEQVMGRIDPREPGRRIGERRGGREIANVSKAFPTRRSTASSASAPTAGAGRCARRRPSGAGSPESCTTKSGSCLPEWCCSLRVSPLMFDRHTGRRSSGSRTMSERAFRRCVRSRVVCARRRSRSSGCARRWWRSPPGSVSGRG